MPITTAVRLSRLNDAQMRELDYNVMALAFDVQRDMGQLCDENVYQADLAARLSDSQLGTIRREVPVHVEFGSFAKIYKLDVVVADSAIYEIKAVDVLAQSHQAQLLNYLLLTDSTRGKLINFRSSSVESRFVNTSLDQAERRRFAVHHSRWQGGDSLCQFLLELLADWGTSLETSLYSHAVIHWLGGEESITCQIPMQRDGVPLGNQRFHLADSESAFFLTTLNPESARSHEFNLHRLLQYSPLSRAHWINIDHHHVQFATISRAGRFWAGK